MSLRRRRLYRRREESKKERESEEELAIAKSILSPHRCRRLAVATVLQPSWPLPLLQPFEENIGTIWSWWWAWVWVWVWAWAWAYGSHVNILALFCFGNFCEFFVGYVILKTFHETVAKNLLIPSLECC